MTEGYWGKLLEVDLGEERISTRTLAEEDLQRFLGGSGIASRILSATLDPALDPYDPSQPLLIIAGLLTGTPVPTACKASFCARSPLTGIWNEATVGGYFGMRLRATGYDGILITGRASRPVYVSVVEDGATIQDATELWGLDTYATDEKLKEILGSKIVTACIGPAGEGLVKISSVMIGGHEGRAAGRGGLGALMGSKNLKAIAVLGERRLEVAQKERLISAVREANSRLKEAAVGLTKFGTAGFVVNNEQSGDMPVANFQGGRWEDGATKTCGQAILEKYFIKNYGCFGCVIRCGKVLRNPSESFKGEPTHSPEYETAAGFGSLCLNENADCIVQAGDLCNRLGLDTISTSAVIAFAMEAWEKRVIRREQGEPEIRWGDPETIIRLIHQIASRMGLGGILGEGVKRAAETLGAGSVEFAIHVKGLEFPYHDPRAFPSMGINYSTANRGACHLEGLTYFVEGGALPAQAIGFMGDTNRFVQDGKADLAIRMQNYMNVLNALGLCKFLIRGKIGPKEVASWVEMVTGWQMDEEELLRIGERLHTQKRLYNVRLGISRKDDLLPLRLLTLDRGGSSTGSLLNWGKGIAEYYHIRGWREDGIPTPEKLKELGIA